MHGKPILGYESLKELFMLFKVKNNMLKCWLEFAFAGWKVIAVLTMYQNPFLTFVSKLILLEWAIVCLQEVREFSLWNIIVKSVFMLSRSLKCYMILKYDILNYQVKL
jgi:hypothetical protein